MSFGFDLDLEIIHLFVLNYEPHFIFPPFFYLIFLFVFLEWSLSISQQLIEHFTSLKPHFHDFETLFVCKQGL
jgi:hypothetical protein